MKKCIKCSLFSTNLYIKNKASQVLWQWCFDTTLLKAGHYCSSNQRITRFFGNQFKVFGDLPGVFSISRYKDERVIFPVKGIFTSRTACSFHRISYLWPMCRYLGFLARKRNTWCSFCSVFKQY